ncbi:MAG TPA: hypothetical protein VIE88_17835 [Vicinamibacteria bacterium]|jgi:hypothetical protein
MNRSAPSPEIEAARLAIAWEIVSRSEINKADPLHAARMVRQVLAIFRNLEGEAGVLPASPRESQGAPGGTLQLTYNFCGGPTSTALTVFVHFVGEGGNVAFQDDHQPPRPTNFWSDRTSYTRDVVIPKDAARGLYRIRVGLYDAFGSHERLDLEPQQGAFAADYRGYEVGSVRIR